MSVVISILLFVFGAVLGSFACCQALRLAYLANSGPKSAVRARRMPNTPCLRSSTSTPDLAQICKSQRSHCFDCGYQLRWFDMIPVASWVVLRGRCRKFSKGEVLSERIQNLI